MSASAKDRGRSGDQRIPLEHRDFYYEDEMAALERVSVGTLRNRISASDNHPPCQGSGKGRKFPKDAYARWISSQLQHEKRKA